MSSMEMIEAFRKGKSPNKVCEDLYAILLHFLIDESAVQRRRFF